MNLNNAAGEMSMTKLGGLLAAIFGVLTQYDLVSDTQIDNILIKALAAGALFLSVNGLRNAIDKAGK